MGSLVVARAGRPSGVGFHEAPRGVRCRTGSSSTTSTSTTTRPSYRRPGTRARATRTGNPGAYEAALVGTPVADPQRPLEILRTLHSFDPCMACAAHLYDADGRDIAEVRVQ